MKLKGFEIENFRSISKVKCDTSQEITIFAGKNESGKTNILDALTLLNGNIPLTEEDRPAYLSKDEPTIISCDFQLTAEEVTRICDSLGVSKENLPTEFSIKYFPKEKNYEVSGSFFDMVCELVIKLKKQDIQKIILMISEINMELQSKGINTIINPIEISLMNK